MGGKNPDWDSKGLFLHAETGLRMQRAKQQAVENLWRNVASCIKTSFASLGFLCYYCYLS